MARMLRREGDGGRGALRIAGAGVGPAVVRRIAERHGGRVWADAEQGRGARLHLALPMPPLK